MPHLSFAAERLWAKKARTGGSGWLPLATHLEDSAALAKRLWAGWTPEGTRRRIAEGCCCGEDAAKQLFVFLAAAHDIGKALPLFQAKTSGFPANDLDERLTEALVSAGLAMQAHSAFTAAKYSPHALAGQMVLEAAGCDRTVSVIVGAHHGRPASAQAWMDGAEERQETNFYIRRSERARWDAVRAELIDFALETAGFAGFDDMPKPDVAAQMLLTGLLIMTDWLASNERYFPYIGVDDEPRMGTGKTRAAAAYREMDFLKTVWQPANWAAADGAFQSRFGFPMRPLQRAVIETANGISAPGLLLIEAPMGVGKTEPALAAAEIFAATSGRSGVYFALPTQATSDGMFPRLLNWVNGLDDGAHSVELVHAKAQFNDVMRGLAHLGGGSEIAPDDADGAVVYTWFEGQKTALLADFAVGTIDQLLRLALKQKHVMLRHLALSNKVVVIDECHAFDSYMNVYLKRTLRWLGAYGVPVILLSATLSAGKRAELVRAYLGNERAAKNQDFKTGVACDAYPLLTYTEGGTVFQKAVEAGVAGVTVDVEPLGEEKLEETLCALLADGGCAGVIVNTVRRAQAVAQTLLARFGSDTVRLLHARFTTTDRIEKERALRAELGKPGDGTVRPFRRIVVATQVVEQSLDLDFDVIMTDLCPADLLLQRMGRLHRHVRARPEALKKARCFVLGAQEETFEPGAAAIYGEYLLMRTRALLPPRLRLPEDISPLVQAVYGGEEAALPSIPAGYEDAKAAWALRVAEKEQRAEAFRIAPPWKGAGNDITGFLDSDVKEAAGEAAVRDAEDTLEVVAVCRDARGELRLISDGRLLPHATPDDATARLIARESLRLPALFGKPYRIDAAITALEQGSGKELAAWQSSPWLRGSLFLILDAQREATLLEYQMKYDGFYGLTCEKEDGMDG